MEMLNPKIVEIIEIDHKNIEDRYFKVCSTWLDSDNSPCYCKLICALEQYNFNSAVRAVKDIISR